MVTGKIQRVSYVKTAEGIIPKQKIVLTKIDKHHYLIQKYDWSQESGTWLDNKSTSFYDGITVHNGVVRHAKEQIDTKFEMLIKWEHYKKVEEPTEE